MVRKGYRIRHFVSGRNKGGDEYRNYSITVPREIAEALQGQNITFIPRMVMKNKDGVDGLLFEPVKQGKNIELPEWAMEEEQHESNGHEEIPPPAAT